MPETENVVIEDDAEFTKNFKIILTVVMFLEVFIGLIPHKCEACRKSVYPLSFLNCFSAGIFLAIAFVHVIPDTTEEWVGWATEQGYSEAFPLPTFMCMVGYCFILLIDRVIARSFNFDSVQEVHMECNKECDGGEECAEEKQKPNQVGLANKSTPNTNEVELAGVGEFAVSTVGQKNKDEDETIMVRENTVSKTAGVVLVLALGVHAFFEGISFGMLPNADAAGQLAAGIFIHKGSSVISLGGALSRSGYSFKAVFGFLLIFAVCAPIGIIIGMNISEESPVIIAVFMGISAGTFLYVASSEIIVNEFERGKYQPLKFFFVVLGATLITVIWLFEGEGENAAELGAIVDSVMNDTE